MPVQDRVESEVLAACRELIHPSIELETKLLDEGILDSFHTLKLIARLETLYSIKIELASVDPADVVSVKAIAALVSRIRAAGSNTPAPSGEE
jgi:acyl carrier protein